MKSRKCRRLLLAVIAISLVLSIYLRQGFLQEKIEESRPLKPLKIGETITRPTVSVTLDRVSRSRHPFEFQKGVLRYRDETLFSKDKEGKDTERPLRFDEEGNLEEPLSYLFFHWTITNRGKERISINFNDGTSSSTRSVLSNRSLYSDRDEDFHSNSYNEHIFEVGEMKLVTGYVVEDDAFSGTMRTSIRLPWDTTNHPKEPEQVQWEFDQSEIIKRSRP